MPRSRTAQLYLDDLFVGQIFESGAHQVEEERLKSFAAEFDPQSFHLDEMAARDTMFGGLVASGWHTAAITMRLLVESVPLARGMIGSGGEIEWTKPVRPGDTLRVRSEILEIVPSRSRPNQARVTLKSITLNGGGEPVQVFTSRLIAYRLQPAE
ncbi:MaoC family dehydratase [Oricola cellulosilytica]|uniref:MaoC family dehydratase n=1 Tax=Oricola cellulosilytica TaxID=1429082 RepID=A0A4R0PF28_9HYPH|nr:MaoC family dehydratase [Oricola cellulosilytica]TCD15179.1 MaoC family dehydratase [Oricola cellulosilytica]